MHLRKPLQGANGLTFMPKLLHIRCLLAVAILGSATVWAQEAEPAVQQWNEILLEAIRNDRSPLCDIEQARWTVEMICGVLESHRQNGLAVSLPLRE